jgi:hypothetical protein
VRESVKSLIIIINCLEQELLDYFANNPQLKVYYDKEDNISVTTNAGASRVLLVNQALEDSQILKIEELIREVHGAYTDQSLCLRRLSNFEVENQEPLVNKKNFPGNKQGAIYV